MDNQDNFRNYEWQDDGITSEEKFVQTQDSDILHFYKNSTVFITGATGFLGKLCMEKLLRTCSVNKIYILVRPKKGKDTRMRLQELFDEPSLDPLKLLRPNFKTNVEIIEGDASQPDLGISIEDQEKIISEVDCIFHYAATVRFNEKLKTATFINIRALRDLLKISKRVKKLRAFIHVSTAYSNCIDDVIEEKTYSPPITGENLIRLIECLNDDQLDAITPALLGDFPNTYTFTKYIAEGVLESGRGMLPVALFRPSIVTATFKEPISGWINNIYGVTGVLVGVGLGILRIMKGNFQNNIDMVPADYVVNCGLSIAWEISTTKTSNDKDGQSEEFKPDREMPVYNYVSTPEQPLTWCDFYSLSKKHGSSAWSLKTVWVFILFVISNAYLYTLMRIILHTIPAYIADFVALCLGKKPKLVEGYQKIHKFISVIEYFSLKNWKFKNDNTQALWKKLTSQDKELFEFSMKNLDWNKYFMGYIKGARVYILKDPLETIPQGRSWYRKLQIMHYTIVTILCLLVVRFVILIF